MNSLYDRIGGAEAVNAAVDVFYQRVLADPDLAPMFARVPMERMRAHQQRFLTFAFGGAAQYAGRGLRQAHGNLVERFGLGDRHFDAVIRHLGDALASLGVAVPLIDEVAAVANSVRAEVLGGLARSVA